MAPLSVEIAMPGSALTEEKSRRMSAPERRAQIFRCAQAIFIQRGFTATTVRDVARSAGVSEPIIYRHFASKEELFEATMLAPATQLCRTLIDSVSSTVDAALFGDLVALNGTEARLLTSTRSALPMIGAIFFAEPDAQSEFYRENWLDSLNGLIEDASSPRRSAATSKAAYRYLFVATFGMNLGFALDEYFGQGSAPITDPAKDVALILRSGLLDTEPECPPRLDIDNATFSDEAEALASTDGSEFSELSSGAQSTVAMINAARESFAKKGLVNTTVRDIVEEVGMTEATLFRRFGSKSQLFEEALLEPIGNLIARLDALVPTFHGGKIQKRLLAGVAANVEMHRTMEEISALLLVALFSDTDRGQSLYSATIYPQFERVADALERSMSESALSRISPQSLLRMMIGMHVAAALPGMTAPGDAPVLSRVFMEIISFGTDGLRHEGDRRRTLNGRGDAQGTAGGP
jgi:AcrR family transcriptional regulator